MGVVGVMLAGGCPFVPGHSGEGLGGSRGLGAKVTVGSSVTGGMTKGARIATPTETASTRVLVVAPSNAAVDELVLRLCQGGVPGPDGGEYFPKVVRVGGGKVDREREGEGGGSGSRAGGRGGGKDATRSSIVEVGCAMCVGSVLPVFLVIWLIAFARRSEKCPSSSDTI